jgi:REP element-mobilizing transposase RayT
MPRPPRLHVEGGLYHVILRGNHRETIFHQPADRDCLAGIVAEVIDRFRMRVHAFCWMTNHIHLVMQVQDVPLGPAMLRIGSRFARHMQRQRPTTGHFFERRYRAILVDVESYFLELLRYVHLNPVRAGIIKDPGDYAWSSHRAYLGAATVPWLTTEFALRLFAEDLAAARRAYAAFVLAGIASSADAQLEAGMSEDARILGTDSFISSLPVKVHSRCRLSLEELIERLSVMNGVSAESLQSPDRSRATARVRALIAHHAVDLRIATLSTVARRFGRSVSAISQSLQHHRKLNPGLFAASVDRITS